MAVKPSMTFPNLDEALRAGFHVYDEHPDGYLVRKEILRQGNSRWILAIALGLRRALH
ncbi:MAG: hypothetical protein ACLPYS_02810 [Vulcanimicrobiaceae bacterium]